MMTMICSPTFSPASPVGLLAMKMINKKETGKKNSFKAVLQHYDSSLYESVMGKNDIDANIVTEEYKIMKERKAKTDSEGCKSGEGGSFLYYEDIPYKQTRKYEVWKAQLSEEVARPKKRVVSEEAKNKLKKKYESIESRYRDYQKMHRMLVDSPDSNINKTKAKLRKIKKKRSASKAYLYKEFSRKYVRKIMKEEKKLYNRVASKWRNVSETTKRWKRVQEQEKAVLAWVERRLLKIK